MSSCMVLGCDSISAPRSSLRFYSFPSDPERRLLWLSKITLKGHLEKGSAVCGLHFRPEDYDKNARLRVDAVPRPAENSHAETITCDDSETKVCRVCLATDRRMLDLRERKLQQAFFDVTGITVCAGLPRALCWECAARVQAAARCRARAHRAHAALLRLRLAQGAITMNGIFSIDRRRQRLTSHLSEQYNTEFIYMNHESVCSDVKVYDDDDQEMIVYDFDDGDTNVIEDIEKVDPINEAERTAQSDDDASDRGEDEPEDRGDIIVIQISDEELNSDEDSDEKDAGNKVDSIVKVVAVEDIVKAKDQDQRDAKAIEDKKELKKRVRPVKRKMVQTVKERMAVQSDDKRRQPHHPVIPKYLEIFAISPVSVEEEIALVEKRKESDTYKRALYRCDVCYRTNKTRYRHEVHMLKHTEKHGNVECVICRTRYKTAAKLRRHIGGQHTEKYSCKKCSFVTCIRNAAKYHYKYHKGISYACPHCPRVFDIATTYYGHVRLKHACKCACALCGHTFVSARGVLRHKSSVHKFDVFPTPLEGPHCDTCDVTFASEEAHARHLTMSSNHNDHPSALNLYRPADERVKRPAAPVTCEQCGETLPTRARYAHHYRKRHGGRAPTAAPPKPAAFMCEQCGRKFQSMAVLRDHARVHGGARALACPVCSRAFLTRASLHAHARAHIRRREQHACRVCGKHFSSHGNRERHEFIHTGLKPHECEACGKRCGTAGDLRSHIDHVHNKKPWPKRVRRRPRAED